jgi:hypothetical protein
MDSDEVALVKSIVVDNWEGSFWVSETSGEISVYVEVTNLGEQSGLRSFVPIDINNKYTLVYTVPPGYIDVFLRNKA